MKFTELLAARKEAIVKGWVDAVFASYPKETQGFLNKQKNQFANPVGHKVKVGLAELWDMLVDPKSETGVNEFLVDIIRVRALQDIAPSGALRFLFQLKDIVRQAVAKDMKNLEEDPGWRALDAKIDALGLMGFDAYYRCREKMHNIRFHEVRNLSYKALLRAGLVADDPELSPEADKGGVAG